MRSSQSLLLVLVLLLAGGAVVGLGLLDDGSAGTGPGAVTSSGDVARVTTPRSTDPARLTSAAKGDRFDASEGPSGDLRLRIVDAAGAPTTAAVRLTHANGQLIESEDETFFQGLAIGDWSLVVKTPGLPAFREDFTLADKQFLTVVAQLTSSFEVKGEVVDLLGQGVGSMPIWFLKRDQTHPADQAATRKVRGCVTKTTGSFRMELDRGGEYRLSVGKPGQPIVQSKERVLLDSGFDKEARIVISGQGRLEIELLSPPTAVAEGKSNLQVAVWTKRDLDRQSTGGRGRVRQSNGTGGGDKGSGRGGGDNAGGDKAGGKGRNKDGADSGAPQKRELLGPGLPGKGEAVDGGGVSGDTGAEDAGGADADYDINVTQASQDGDNTPTPQESSESHLWLERSREGIPADGKVTFESLPADVDLKVVLYKRADIFESEPFRIAPNRVVQVSFQAPAKRTKEEIAALPAAPLPCQVGIAAPPGKLLQVGITWK